VVLAGNEARHVIDANRARPSTTRVQKVDNNTMERRVRFTQSFAAADESCLTLPTPVSRGHEVQVTRRQIAHSAAS